MFVVFLLSGHKKYTQGSSSLLLCNVNVNVIVNKIYCIAPKVEGKIRGAGVWVTRRDRQKRKGEI